MLIGTSHHLKTGYLIGLFSPPHCSCIQLLFYCSQTHVIQQKASFPPRLRDSLYCSRLASHCSGIECLWAAPSFLAALQALIVHPAPAPVFLGKPKRVVARAAEKESHKFPQGRRSLFLALRQSQAGEVCAAVATAVCLARNGLPCSTHATSPGSPSQLPAAVGRLKLLEQRKGHLQVP